MEKKEYEIILDDVERVRATDPSNMYNRIFDLPEQMSKALKLTSVWDVKPDDFPDPKNVVVIGMGGSAIGGDLARTYLTDKLLIPFHICRNYELPEFVDDETLVIASSYSGNTEETLSALDDALARKAMIAGITTGGLLEDVCKLNDIPLMLLPTGLQPRAAIGYSFVPTLLLFEKIGLVEGVREELEGVVAKLVKLREKYIEDNPTISNPAKRLAGLMHGRIPIIYSGPTLTDVVAVRWKGQICENGKNLAFCNHFPEMNHNELVGWSRVVEEYADRLMVVFLRDENDHPKVRRRMNIVKDIIDRFEVEVADLHSMGENALQRMFSLIQMGDFISYYLAILNDMDPTPVDVIESLKAQLVDIK
jgi:glucose/mannose-6-phosphate isomerase